MTEKFDSLNAGGEERVEAGAMHDSQEQEVKKERGSSGRKKIRVRAKPIVAKDDKSPAITGRTDQQWKEEVEKEEKAREMKPLKRHAITPLQKVQPSGTTPVSNRQEILRALEEPSPAVPALVDSGAISVAQPSPERDFAATLSLGPPDVQLPRKVDNVVAVEDCEEKIKIEPLPLKADAEIPEQEEIQHEQPVQQIPDPAVDTQPQQNAVVVELKVGDLVKPQEPEDEGSYHFSDMQVQEKPTAPVVEKELPAKPLEMGSSASPMKLEPVKAQDQPQVQIQSRRRIEEVFEEQVSQPSIEEDARPQPRGSAPPMEQEIQQDGAYRFVKTELSESPKRPGKEGSDSEQIFEKSLGARVKTHRMVAHQITLDKSRQAAAIPVRGETLTQPQWGPVTLQEVSVEKYLRAKELADERSVEVARLQEELRRQDEEIRHLRQERQQYMTEAQRGREAGFQYQEANRELARECSGLRLRLADLERKLEESQETCGKQREELQTIRPALAAVKQNFKVTDAAQAWDLYATLLKEHQLCLQELHRKSYEPVQHNKQLWPIAKQVRKDFKLLRDIELGELKRSVVQKQRLFEKNWALLDTCLGSLTQKFPKDDAGRLLGLVAKSVEETLQEIGSRDFAVASLLERVEKATANVAQIGRSTALREEAAQVEKVKIRNALCAAFNALDPVSFESSLNQRLRDVAVKLQQTEKRVWMVQDRLNAAQKPRVVQADSIDSAALAQSSGEIAEIRKQIQQLKATLARAGEAFDPEGITSLVLQRAQQPVKAAEAKAAQSIQLLRKVHLELQRIAQLDAGASLADCIARLQK